MDQPADKIIGKALEINADIIGMSALLTTTMVRQREVIEELDKEGLRPRIKVMVGGAPITRDWVTKIKADGYSEDAIGAVKIAKELVGKAARKRRVNITRNKTLALGVVAGKHKRLHVLMCNLRSIITLFHESILSLGSPMQPSSLLSGEIIARILEEAYELLLKPGIKVQNEEARNLLAKQA